MIHTTILWVESWRLSSWHSSPDPESQSRSGA